MNKKTILTQFSSDLEKIIEGREIDLTSINDKNYKTSIDTAALLIESLPKSPINQKEELKAKVFKQIEQKQSLSNQINESIHFSLMGMKKRITVAATPLVLCILLILPPTSALAENTFEFIKEIIASYQLGNHTTVQQVEFDITSTEQLSSLQPPLNMWTYKMKIGTFGGNVLSGESAALQTFKSIEEGQNAVDFTLKIPTYMPEESNLREMVLSPSGHVFLVYDSPKGEIDMIQKQMNSATKTSNLITTVEKEAIHITTNGKTEAIQINGKEAIWSEDEEKNTIVWEDNAFFFSLGGNLSKDEIIKIVSSLK